jgi:hypothetical protein
LNSTSTCLATISIITIVAISSINCVRKLVETKRRRKLNMKLNVCDTLHVHHYIWEYTYLGNYECYKLDCLLLLRHTVFPHPVV